MIKANSEVRAAMKAGKVPACLLWCTDKTAGDQGLLQQWRLACHDSWTDRDAS